MAATRPGNVVARRVTDDLMAFSGETAIPKYMKFLLVQKVAETRRLMNRMRDKADAIRSCIAQMTDVIVKLQAMEDQDEVHDSLLAAKDAKCGEESKLLALHEFYNLGSSMPSDHELFSLMHECVVLEMCDLVYGRQINSCRIWFLTMAALYILDKLSEVSNSSQLEDKMKVMFSRTWDSNESFIELLRELYSAISVTISKDRRLIAELEALGQRADVLKSLEYMMEMVAWDSEMVGVLEQLLAGAHVGMRLKAEYAADMGKTVYDFIVCSVLLGVALMKRRNMTVLVHFISLLFDDNVKVDFVVIWELNMKKPDTGIVDAEMFLDSECAL
uniref:Uncharacterized protein n=1 Tax=Tanacetum cinerariifolium TaxID=118510 RepID=A0A6L2J3J2_TANCI|nr:hypothetical protein [Tanacetum cinerariifolium]